MRGRRFAWGVAVVVGAAIATGLSIALPRPGGHAQPKSTELPRVEAAVRAHAVGLGSRYEGTTAKCFEARKNDIVCGLRFPRTAAWAHCLEVREPARAPRILCILRNSFTRVNVFVTPSQRAAPKVAIFNCEDTDEDGSPIESVEVRIAGDPLSPVAISDWLSRFDAHKFAQRYHALGRDTC